MKSFAGSSEAAYEGYRMSKSVHRIVQSKVKKFRSEPVVHFPPASVSLMNEWHQITMIHKIRKVSTI
jgi:hypothetical protein